MADRFGLSRYWQNRQSQKQARQETEAAAGRTYEEARVNALRQYRSKQSKATQLAATDREAAQQMNMEAAKDYEAQMKQIESQYKSDMKNAKAVAKNPEIAAEINKQNDAGGSSSNGGNESGGNESGGNESGGNESGGNESGGSAIKDVVGGVLAHGMAKKIAGKGDETGAQGHLRNQASMHDKQAGDEQKNAQANFQVANRDYRVEAEKNAVSQAASENAQKVNNMGNASAGAAALERGVKSADYNTHMQRQDQQRQQGVDNQREMWGNRQVAEYERGVADVDAYKQKQTKVNNIVSDTLSMGKPEQKQEEQPQQEEPQEEPQEEEQPQQEEPQEEEQPQQEEPQEDEGPPPEFNAQSVMNWLQGSSVRYDNGTKTRVDDPSQIDPKVKAYLEKIHGGPVTPIATEYDPNQARANDAKIKELYPEFAQLWEKASGRGELASKNQKDATSQQEATSTGLASNYNTSDRRMKNIINTLSQFKYF